MGLFGFRQNKKPKVVPKDPTADPAEIAKIAKYVKTNFDGAQECDQCHVVAPPENTVIEVVEHLQVPPIGVLPPGLYRVGKLKGESHVHTVELTKKDGEVVPVFLASGWMGGNPDAHLDWRGAKKSAVEWTD